MSKGLKDLVSVSVHETDKWNVVADCNDALSGSLGKRDKLGRWSTV